MMKRGLDFVFFCVITLCVSMIEVWLSQVLQELIYIMNINKIEYKIMNNKI